MSKFQYDLIVIGAGSGGIRAARTAASFGARVMVAEYRYLGGTCVNVGCIPKKIFVYAAQFAKDFETAKNFGWQCAKPDFTWQTLLANKNAEINRLNAVYQTLLEQSGVTIIEGRAVVMDKHHVKIDQQQISAERILIATGGAPMIPELAGKEYILSSNDMFFLKSLPKTIIIVGGGYIAVEFAGIMKGLGVETTLVYRGELFMRGFDLDLRKRLETAMRQNGIKLKFNTTVAQIKQESNQLIATLANGNELSAEKILYATGRRPKTDHIGLAEVGVALDEQGAIKVNQSYQTTVASIYAIGDVTNRFNLTPVALSEATALTRHLYQGQDCNVDYTMIPTCVFSQPNIATVGLTEDAARQQYDEIVVYQSAFTAMKQTLSDKAAGNDQKTFMKLIVDKQTERVIGAHMLGENAGEILQGISIAIQAGATKQDFDATLAIHPTIAEEFVMMREPK